VGTWWRRVCKGDFGSTLLFQDWKLQLVRAVLERFQDRLRCLLSGRLEGLGFCTKTSVDLQDLLVLGKEHLKTFCGAHDLML
jgi:hypothetical protein